LLCSLDMNFEHKSHQASKILRDRSSSYTVDRKCISCFAMLHIADSVGLADPAGFAAVDSAEFVDSAVEFAADFADSHFADVQPMWWKLCGLA
jgi:hypothetical protein